MKEKIPPLKLCLGTTCSFSPLLDQDAYEDVYSCHYKPLISMLYNNPELNFTLYLSGLFIEWAERNHDEFFMIIEELVARKQVEVLGGGYYNPLYPIIPPADRVGQTELLTTALRKNAGKRPRGLYLPASAWDPSIISSLNSCGIEYILLDRFLFKAAGQTGVDGTLPVILEDNGKTITAVPLDNSYLNIHTTAPDVFIQELSSGFPTGREAVTVVMIQQNELQNLFTNNGNGVWIDALMELYSRENVEFELTTPAKYLKNKPQYFRASIGAGISPLIKTESFPDTDPMMIARTSLKQIIVRSPSLMNLYAKMMYVHAMANQLKGDKSRKKNAREELWQAQNHLLYLVPAAQTIQEIRKLRNYAYRSLLLAEKSSRIRGIFSSSINAYDFDMDGQKEYLCQLDTINCYVHNLAGKIFEFDILAVNRNYVDCVSVDKGLFIDHFMDKEDAQRIRDGHKPVGEPVFAHTLYQDGCVDTSRMELNLRANGFYGSFLQPILLRKQYMFRNEGIQVQYILKNESPFPLSGIFMIELDLAISPESPKEPVMAVYTEDVRKEGPIETCTYDDVSWIRLDDQETGTRFTLDSNENSTATIIPIHDTLSTKVFLSWNVELSPNFETEKMVFLKISC